MAVQLQTNIQEYMQEYFDAWTEGDQEKLLSLFSDDVVINLFGVPATLEGKEAVREGFVIPFCTGFPGNVHEYRNFIHHGNQVIVEWSFKAVHQGDFAGIPASGNAVNLPGCSVYTLKDGKIAAGNLYFNGPTLWEQLGASR